MMTAAYIYFLFSVLLRLNLLCSSALTLISVCLISLIILKTFILPFLQQNLFLVFVTTLALATILESIVSIAFGVNVKSLEVAPEYASSIQLGSVYITPIQILIIISALLLLIFLAFIVHKTPFGRNLRAFSAQDSAAESLGISRNRITSWVFVISCLIAGYSGVLIAYESNLQPTMGSTYTIKAFAAMILGGLGNIWGTIIGSYLLGLVENLSIGLEFGDFSIPAGYKDAFAFAIILLVLLVKPSGLFNKRATRKA